MLSDLECAIDPREQAIQILQHTHDGNLLSMEDLALLETVVNSGLNALTPQGQEYWNELHNKAINGRYTLPWLHEQENLTKDQEGYVYWKGIRIEHYTFKDYAKEAVAARELARVCLTVEARNLPMSWASCLQVYEDARFGQGLETQRCHVFWMFTDDQQKVAVFEEKSKDRQEAASNAHQLMLALMREWNCPEGALRQNTVMSDQTLAECIRNIRSDAAWARAVLRTDVERCRSLEESFHQQLQSTFPQGINLSTQRTLSEYILVKPTETPTIDSATPLHSSC